MLTHPVTRDVTDSAGPDAKRLNNWIKRTNNVRDQKIRAFNYRRKVINSTRKDKNWQYLIAPKDKSKRWQEYIKEQYGYEKPQVEINQVNLPIMHEETMAAIKRLPNGQALGCDRIPAELLKSIGESPERSNGEYVWERRIARRFYNSLCTQIPQKNNAMDCKDYRKISLDFKILLWIV